MESLGVNRQMHSYHALKSALRNKYDVVLGFGMDCANAAYMRLMAHRTTSSPFDWIGGWDSGFEMYVKMAISEFEGFCDCDDLELMPHPRGSYDDLAHEYVRSTKKRFQFLHDFPYGVPLANSFIEVKEKYDRRCRRFCSILRQHQPVLLTQWNRVEQLELDTVYAGLERIRCHFGNPLIDLMVICHDPTSSGIKVCSKNGAIVVTARSYDPNISVVMGNVELCKPIYAAIASKGCIVRLLKRLIRNKWRKLVRRIYTSFRLRSIDRRRARERWDATHNDDSGLKD